MPQNIPAFFESYANLYNRALAGEDVHDEIMGRFSDRFIAASPSGIATGKQGGAFRRALDKAYRFYRDIGTKKMTARRVEVTPIDLTHCMAKVFYRADYEKSDGAPLSIDFDLTYLLDTSSTRPKIFGFVVGDEMETYRKHGLLRDQPKPPKQSKERPASQKPSNRQSQSAP